MGEIGGFADESVPQVSINDRSGYPRPKDGAILTLLPTGAWCPQCHTVWREVGEVDIADLDALPGEEVTDGK